MKTIPTQSEHSIQVALFTWAKMQSNVYPELDMMFAVPNGGARSKVTGAMLKAEGVKRGVPDIFLPAQRGDKHGLFIEMKKKGGRLSEHQKKWLDRLNNAGYAVCVCYSFDAAVSEIKGYLEVRK